MTPFLWCAVIGCGILALSLVLDGLMDGLDGFLFDGSLPVIATALGVFGAVGAGVLRMGAGRGCSGSDWRVLRGVIGHNKQAFRFTRRMACGPGGDIAVSPGCQEAEQRSIGIADLTAKTIG